MDELTDGRLSEAQIGGVLAALTGDLVTARDPGRFCLGPPQEEEALRKRPPRPGHLRHRRRWTGHIQHLLPCGRRRGLLRRAGCKAWEQGGHNRLWKRGLLPRARRGR